MALLFVGGFTIDIIAPQWNRDRPARHGAAVHGLQGRGQGHHDQGERPALQFFSFCSEILRLQPFEKKYSFFAFD